MTALEHIALIGVLNLIVYYRTLFFGLVGDDVERHMREEKFKNAWHRRWLQFIGMKHINSMVSHFITIVTHTICCITIYLALGKNNISFLTAILFSINPVNMQGSIWISGRNYVVSSILTLGMFLFPGISWLFYMATAHFAVNSWFAPILFLGTKYWYMVFIIPLIWIVDATNRNTLNRKLWETGGLKTTNAEMRAIKLKKIIPFIKTYIYYFSLCVFPYFLGIEHTFLRGFGTNQTDNQKAYKKNWIFYTGLIVFLLIVGASGWCIISGWNPVIWGLFWFTVNIAMWCNFVTYQQQIAERYCYLANIGMMFAIANLIIGYPILIGIFITAYLVRLWFIMDMYLNDWWVVEYTIREIKNCYYIWLMRGVKKFMEQDFKGAFKDFNEAYLHKPYDLKVLYNLSTVCFVLGDLVQAKKFLELAKKNVYDELDEDVKPAFQKTEEMIKKLEDSRARGETAFNINLNELLIVK